MPDPDHWRSRNVHWHAYVEIYESSAGDYSTRAQRLAGKPDIVLFAPEDAANWIATMIRRHIHRRAIRLIGSDGRVGHIGDEQHIEQALISNLDDLCHGNSVYQDIPRQTDRLHLWLEAVTPEQCPEAKHHRENP
ncbi:hypothetical protein [Saccharopolyspora phatthalungensis]|uniref:Uncharacterized protein n=1 Tax=Saccharopolyspora phatthalungensis TaxID=664693 RepID=A0A840PZE2_9PSEU|nr:hypothetical protein [Saccharopolyspora phatthalungensis]MBB5152591.1 hypothetical protein [Saccharopolyspora phatthalungensis]